MIFQQAQRGLGKQPATGLADGKRYMTFTDVPALCHFPDCFPLIAAAQLAQELHNNVVNVSS